MQKKYHDLSKEDKKKIKEKYRKEYAKSDIEARFKRLIIYSIVGYVFSIILIIYSIITKEDITSNLLVAIPLLIISTIFTISVIILKRRIYNKLTNQ